MSALLDALMSQVDSGTVSAMSRTIGADPAATQQAIGAALPVLLGALAKNSTGSQGAASLANALQSHDGGILDDLVGAVSAPQHQQVGNSILRHVLGDRRGAVEGGLTQVSGLSGAQGAQLLAMLAPIVMGMLGRQSRQGGLDAGSIGDYLGGQRSSMQQRLPPQHSMLTSLLDRDGDGGVADDIGRMGMGILGDLMKPRK